MQAIESLTGCKGGGRLPVRGSVAGWEGVSNPVYAGSRVGKPIKAGVDAPGVLAFLPLLD